jgi:hypothetical protein
MEKEEGGETTCDLPDILAEKLARGGICLLPSPSTLTPNQIQPTYPTCSSEGVEGPPPLPGGVWKRLAY